MGHYPSCYSYGAAATQLVYILERKYHYRRIVSFEDKIVLSSVVTRYLPLRGGGVLTN